MTPIDPRLQDMQDIIAAPAASWWPLAPGWYALAATALTLVLVTSWLLYRRYQERRMQRAALRQLQQLTATASIAELTHLLKQTTQAYFPNHALVSLPTAKWHAFLLQQLSNSAQARYSELLDEIAAQLNSHNHVIAVQLAALPDAIRGYGPVKREAAQLAETQREELLAALKAPPSKRQRAA